MSNNGQLRRGLPMGSQLAPASSPSGASPAFAKVHGNHHAHMSTRSRAKMFCFLLVISLIGAVSFTDLLPYRLMEIEEVESLRTKLDRTRSTLAETKRSLQDAEAKHKEAVATNTDLSSDLKRAQNKVLEVEAHLIELKGEKEQLGKDLDAAKDEMSAVQSNLDDAVLAKEEVEAKLSDQAEELEELKAKKDTTIGLGRKATTGTGTKTKLAKVDDEDQSDGDADINANDENKSGGDGVGEGQDKVMTGDDVSNDRVATATTKNIRTAEKKTATGKKKTTKTLGLRGTQKVGTATDEAGELKADEDEDEKEVAPTGKAKDSVSNDDEGGEEKEENDESDDGDADKKEKPDDGNADSNDNAIATKKKKAVYAPEVVSPKRKVLRTTAEADRESPDDVNVKAGVGPKGGVVESPSEDEDEDGNGNETDDAKMLAGKKKNVIASDDADEDANSDGNKIDSEEDKDESEGAAESKYGVAEFAKAKDASGDEEDEDGNQIDKNDNGSEDKAARKKAGKNSDDLSDDEEKLAAAKEDSAVSDDEEKKEIINDQINKAASTN